jgi:hypothetical protein
MALTAVMAALRPSPVDLCSSPVAVEALEM